MSATTAPVEGRPQPNVTDESRPFWEATREQRLVLQWCEDCGRVVHFPRSFCPSCAGHRLTWREASGRGVLYSFTVDHRPLPPFGPELWTVALVDLEEGARLMTNVVDCAPDDIRVGLPLEVVWEPLPDGRHLALFKPLR